MIKIMREGKVERYISIAVVPSGLLIKIVFTLVIPPSEVLCFLPSISLLLQYIYIYPIYQHLVPRTLHQTVIRLRSQTLKDFVKFVNTKYHT